MGAVRVARGIKGFCKGLFLLLLALAGSAVVASFLVAWWAGLL